LSELEKANRKFEGRLSTLRKAFTWLARVYWSEKRIWLPGFLVSSIGVDEGTIKKYVDHQGRQDSGQRQLNP
jgi:putative transposase